MEHSAFDHDREIFDRIRASSQRQKENEMTNNDTISVEIMSLN